MGGSSYSAAPNPQPSDYIPLINEQAKANRVNTSNPIGQTQFKQNPDGTWSSINSYTPVGQNLFTSYLNTMQDPGVANSYTDAAFANARRMLDPYYQQQTQSFDQTMANQGLPVL